MARRPGRDPLWNPGPAGKRAALLHALTVESPPVAAEVDALIQMVIARGYSNLVDDILRAGFIVARGQVKHARPLTAKYLYVGEVARVESSSTPGS